MFIDDINYILIWLYMVHFLIKKYQNIYFLYLIISIISFSLDIILRTKFGSCGSLIFCSSYFNLQHYFYIILILIALFLYINNIFSIYLFIITSIKLIFIKYL
jgi:hypothetical protein